MYNVERFFVLYRLQRYKKMFGAKNILQIKVLGEGLVGFGTLVGSFF